MILVIDNYDSFTYNLVAYLEVAGAPVRVVRNDAVTVMDAMESGCTGILLSPGPGTPDDAGISVELVRAAAGRVPVLGVCLGHQAIARAFGARIGRAAELVHGKASAIHHDGRTIFHGQPDPLQVGRYHSLTVSRQGFPEALEVSAWTGTGAVMGLRHRELPLEGLQFHPESILTPGGMELLGCWLDRLPL
ncbi:MAG: aminodeoxychorismate/anthranilate synthase component II [Acidobacteriota bacterium]|jgi:anthranilate synthase/aminodeoxychorismate synthase-like glutamine amidotransferase